MSGEPVPEGAVTRIEIAELAVLFDRFEFAFDPLATAAKEAESDFEAKLNYLLASQLDDGSWHVRTRSEPIQTYYESGYPHDKDQFISISAAGWATTALALALPTTPVEKGPAQKHPGGTHPTRK